MLSVMKKHPYIVSSVVCIVIMLSGCKEQSITTAPAPDHQLLLTETSYPAPSETAKGNSQTLMPIENTSQQSEKSYLAAILSGVRIVNEPYQIVFIDSNDEILWMIEDQYSGLLTFDTSGCYLLSGWYKDRYAEISKHSLKGEVLEIKSETYDEKLKAPDGTYNFLPSPSGDHLAYMVSSGEGGRACKGRYLIKRAMVQG
jgi:hypothetical protein